MIAEDVAAGSLPTEDDLREMDTNTKRVEDLDVESVAEILDKWGMGEFAGFVKERQLDGRKLLAVTEGIVKLWNPKVDARKFIVFIQDLKTNRDKYLDGFKEESFGKNEIVNATTIIESQYQTVTVRKVKEELTTTNNVEELLKKLVPAKSFLYRNQAKIPEKTTSSYLPMEAGTTKKPKRFFRLSSYEYPHFDLKQRFSKGDFSDRGYYSVKTNSRYYIQKTCRKPEGRTKHKSLSTTEELNEKYPDDHFYEDLCYNDIENKDENIKIKETTPIPIVNVKPCIAKIQELFNSFKLPFFKRTEEVAERDKIPEVFRSNDKEGHTHIYENSDSMAGMSMYDSVRVRSPSEENKEHNQAKLPVEDYLEPIQTNKDYCDVEYNYKHKDDSILRYIINLFESRFGIRRETNEDDPEEFEVETVKDVTPPITEPRDSSPKCLDPNRPRKTNMADRPLPVPVENEPYYMNIDRTEAENILKGQPDGTFVLRPSSQPNHAYTLSVSCAHAVHNVGVRRRPDGRLALGFARRGERSFISVTSLLRHHKRRRLLLVAGGGVLGATTLNETPHYYQTPSNIPVPVRL